MHFGWTVVAAIGVLFLSSCGKYFSANVVSSIQITVEEAQKDQTLLDWESNQNHPSKVFAQVRENDTEDNRKALCEGLKELTLLKLQIFQNEINSKKNAELLNGCLSHLKYRLEQFWTDQRKEFESRGLSTLDTKVNQFAQFETEVQERDLTQKYVAVTGDVGLKKVILTFDDGPDSELTPKLLEVLRSYGVRVMFFMQGEHVVEYPEIVKQVHSEGHVVGSHSFTHSYMGDLAKCKSEDCKSKWIDEDKAKADLAKGHLAVFDVLGEVAPFVRFPFGARTPGLAQFLVDKQIGDFFWNVDSLDWKPMQTNQELLDRTLNAMDERQKGIVVLFHDIQRRTIETMPAFLQLLFEKGYRPVILTGRRTIETPL
jgi:peptidoglycan/xylan/chitin deacetylase (PgdA/CDA1 family)